MLTKYFAVVVVEQRGSNPEELTSGRTTAFDARRGDDKVVRVLERTVLALDVGIDQPELRSIADRQGAQMPQESGSPRMSSWLCASRAG